MAQKYYNKTVTFDSDSERLLEEIKKELGAESGSAALRYCIKQTHRQILKLGA